MAKFARPLVSLHTHSTGSMLDGASTPQQHVDFCVMHNIPGMGLTDHGTMVGIHDFVTYSQKKSIVGVPGCEIYLDLSPDFDGYGHLTIWALDTEGFRILSILSSRAYDNKVTRFGKDKPRVLWSELEQYNLKGHLAAGTGCIVGAVARPFLDGKESVSVKNLNRLIEIFGKENLYAEVMFHKITHDYDRKTKQFVPNPCTPICPDGDPQRAYNQWILRQSDIYNLKVVTTDDAHFCYPEDKVLQDALLTNGDPTGWRFHSSYHRQSAEEAFSVAQDTVIVNESKFEGWLDNSLEILDKAKNFKFAKQLVMPPINIPQIYVKEKDPYLLKALDKIKEIGRLIEEPKYKERLEYELKVISDNGVVNFLPYFLFLSEICSVAREKDITMGPCRGSAGGSLLSYFLGITHLDPIKLNLPFERFLSFDRIKRQKFPDIDLDFDASRRHELVEYLQLTYGDKCAQIGTHSTLGLKQALQDASRAVYGEVLPEVYAMNRDLKSAPQGVNIHDYLYGYTDEDGNPVQGYIEQNSKLSAFLKAQPKIKNLLEKMCGITRQFGRHAGGFCLADKPVYEYIPTAKIGKESHYITQYSKDWVEKAGLIKMDLLGVNTLSDIGSCLKLIQERYGQKIDIYNLPEESDVFDQYHKGDTITVFQMEPGTTCHYDARSKRSWLRDMKPSSIADLAVVTALVRPGALDALIEDGKTTAAAAYVDRKNGQQFEYLHKDLKEIVGDTYGIFTYQEQVMQLFIDLAGYTMEKADVVREGIGKKKQDVIDSAKKDLEKALLGRSGWTQEKIDILSQQVQAFAKYAFNKSHAAGYGMLSYISAYLKKKYPLEWWASVLSNSDKEEIKDKYWSSVKDFVLLPSVNNSNTNFKIFENKIKSPLSLIHGVGPSAYQEIVTKAPYMNLLDFFTRTNGRVVKLDTVEALAYGGALSELTSKSPADIMAEYFVYKKNKDPKYKQTKDFSKFSKIDTLLKIKKHLPMLRVDYSDYYNAEFQKMEFLVAAEHHRASGLEFYKQTQYSNELVLSSAETALKYKDKYPLKQDVTINLIGIAIEFKSFDYIKKSTGEKKSAVKVKLISRDQPFSIIYWGQRDCPIELNSLVMVTVPYEDITYNDRDYLSFGKFKAKVIDRKNIIEEGD